MHYMALKYVLKVQLKDLKLIECKNQEFSQMK